MKLNLLLLGESQGGKSSAGDTILGRRVFQTATTGTTHSSMMIGQVFGRQVAVVDTPGWSPWSSSTDRVSHELSRGIDLCQTEPHAILLVISATATFGPEQWRRMEAHLKLLQIVIWQRALVLFTHGDILGSLPIQEHVRRQGKALQWLLERCGYRNHVMTSQGRKAGSQVQELLLKVERMVEANREPVEVRQRIYAQLRSDLRTVNKGVEMTVMDRKWRQAWIASGQLSWPQGVPTQPGMKLSLGLVLLGRRLAGKSAAGNIILGRKEFCPGAKTVCCAVGHGDMSGQSVIVVDTPGWSMYGLASPQQVSQEITRSPSLCPPGSKVAFLLAIPVDTAFREKDRRAVQRFLGVLEDRVWRSTVILFTYGRELKGRSIEKHIEKMGVPLQSLVEKCGHRHCVFDTKHRDQTQVSQLLDMVKHM